jgi:serine/threonine-protein kinase PknG
MHPRDPSQDDGKTPRRERRAAASGLRAVYAAPVMPPSVRKRFGAGWVDMPLVPYREPESAVLADPVVPEERRFCSGCGAAVGRGQGGAPGALRGYCPYCGTSFSFELKLRPREWVAGRFRVVGPLTLDGPAAIYLAQDRESNDRWVVLRELVGHDATRTGDIFAGIDHPNIAEVYDVVTVLNSDSGGRVSYLVTEYLGGRTLREVALAHQQAAGHAGPLPLSQVIAYGLDILSVLDYLHARGLLHTDLTPDHLVQVHDQLKLGDLDALRRMDDLESPLLSTMGYGAPELAEGGASVTSDLYTVGRTLAVLSFDVADFAGTYRESLPGPDQVPMFRTIDSYYRFLRRATHVNPDRRFSSADEMADQLTGVLVEVLARKDRRDALPSRVSTVFYPQRHPFGTSTTEPPQIADVITGLALPRDDSLETVQAQIEGGELAEVRRQLAAEQSRAAEAGSPLGWRNDWYRGLIELADGRPSHAREAFEAVYDQLPGELAPKLALAVSAELSGDHAFAQGMYLAAMCTDKSFAGAMDGLVRVSPSREEAASTPATSDAPRRRPGWRAFVEGMAEALSSAAPATVWRWHRRLRRSNWDRIETQLRDAYRDLGSPEPAGHHDTPTGKDGHR